jgi:hypothetical protein
LISSRYAISPDGTEAERVRGQEHVLNGGSDRGEIFKCANGFRVGPRTHGDDRGRARRLARLFRKIRRAFDAGR